MKKNILAKSVNSICKYMLAGVMLTSGIIAAAGENKVVASFGILGDITKQIAGDKVKVTTIVPVDSDPHAYDLTPANMIDLDKGNLIIINGLGFEGYLERYLNQDKFKNKIVVASKGVSVGTDAPESRQEEVMQDIKQAIKKDSSLKKVDVGTDATDNKGSDDWTNW